MGCPCQGGAAGINVPGARFTGKTYQTKGETSECYSKRAQDGDPSGAGEFPVNKIQNTTIPVDCALKIDQQFKLTPKSIGVPAGTPAVSDPPAPQGAYTLPVKWSIIYKDEDEVVIAPGDLGLTFTTEGKLSGTVKPAYELKTVTATVTAMDSSSVPTPPMAAQPDKEVDVKTYTFTAKKCDKDDLKFTHPLPGAIRTSPFGNRIHPVTGEEKMHKGVDFAFSGGKLGDVVAAADGKVIRVVTDGSSSGYGNVIYISHKSSSGVELAISRYAHISAAYVGVGDQVAAGTKIAKEGNVGVGTGAHLHFEIRLAGDEAVNPEPYIQGKLVSSSDTNSDPSNPGTDTKETTNAGTTALTTAEIAGKGKCKPISDEPDQTYKGQKSPDAQHFGKAACRPPDPEGHPDMATVKSRILAALDAYPELNADDRTYFLSMCKIECSYDPFAGAGSSQGAYSSALGPYQMLNATAAEYYSKIGIEPTCENRCNIEKATKAMVIMYKEQKKIYNEYKSTGKILSKFPPDNAHTANYSTMTSGEFIYMIHHDGQGSVQRGNNLQGAGYWKTHSPTA